MNTYPTTKRAYFDKKPVAQVGRRKFIGTGEWKSRRSETNLCSCRGQGKNHTETLRLAILELYDQQIRPTNPEVKRRLEKRGACAYLIKNCVTQASSASTVFQVSKTNEPNGVHEYTIYLVKSPPNWSGFIDPSSEELPYPESCLALAMKFLLDRLHEQQPPLKGGRFLVAMELKNSGPPAIQKLNLGQLCHLVQVLLNEGMIAYESNYIKPVAGCESLTRTIWARLTRSDAAPDFSASLQQIRMDLRDLLAVHPQGIVLSQFRNFYETRFNRSLDFRDLGYTKLASFLKERCATVCELVSTGPFNSIVVAVDAHPVKPPFAPTTAREPRDSGSLVDYLVYSLQEPVSVSADFHLTGKRSQSFTRQVWYPKQSELESLKLTSGGKLAKSQSLSRAEVIWAAPRSLPTTRAPSKAGSLSLSPVSRVDSSSDGSASPLEDFTPLPAQYCVEVDSVSMRSTISNLSRKVSVTSEPSTTAHDSASFEHTEGVLSSPPSAYGSSQFDSFALPLLTPRTLSHECLPAYQSFAALFDAAC